MKHGETRKILLAQFDYLPERGVFLSKQDGNDVGCNTGKYHTISYMENNRGRSIKRSRAAFLVVHGYLPEIVDHVNGDKKDDRIKNLRAATRSQNATNVKGTFTKRGVTSMGNGKYHTVIKKDRTTYRLGVYKTEKEAATAYNIAARRLHGEFASLNDISEIDGVQIELHEMGSGIGKKKKNAKAIAAQVLKKTGYIESEDKLYWYHTDKKLPFDQKSKHRFLGAWLTRSEVIHIHNTGRTPEIVSKSKRHKWHELESPEERFQFICDFKQNITYNKDDGFFYGKHRRLSDKKCSQGYRYVNYKGRRFLAHRLAYLLTYNEWPACVDHINGDRGDNRIANLRAASHRQNMANAKRKKSKSGYIGVQKHRKKWKSKIGYKGKTKLLGIFHTPEDAAKRRDQEAVKIHGEFATLNFTNG